MQILHSPVRARVTRYFTKCLRSENSHAVIDISTDFSPFSPRTHRELCRTWVLLLRPCPYLGTGDEVFRQTAAGGWMPCDGDCRPHRAARPGSCGPVPALQDGAPLLRDCLACVRPCRSWTREGSSLAALKCKVSVEDMRSSDANRSGDKYP